MDRRVGACVASFVPSWLSFQDPSSAFRIDSLALAICDPLIGIINDGTSLQAQRSNGQSRKSLQGSRPFRCYITHARGRETFFPRRLCSKQTAQLRLCPTQMMQTTSIELKYTSPWRLALTRGFVKLIKSNGGTKFRGVSGSSARQFTDIRSGQVNPEREVGGINVASPFPS